MYNCAWCMAPCIAYMWLAWKLTVQSPRVVTLMHRVSNLQEYTEEVKQLLSLAKHPKTIALLQGALLRVQPPASSDGPATGRGPQAVVKAQRSAKEKPVYTAKINEYGEWVHGLSRSGK